MKSQPAVRGRGRKAALFAGSHGVQARDRAPAHKFTRANDFRRLTATLRNFFYSQPLRPEERRRRVSKDGPEGAERMLRSRSILRDAMPTSLLEARGSLVRLREPAASAVIATFQFSPGAQPGAAGPKAWRRSTKLPAGLSFRLKCIRRLRKSCASLSALTAIPMITRISEIVKHFYHVSIYWTSSAKKPAGPAESLKALIFLDPHPLLLGIALAGGEADGQSELDGGELLIGQFDLRRRGALLKMAGGARAGNGHDMRRLGERPRDGQGRGLQPP